MLLKPIAIAIAVLQSGVLPISDIPSKLTRPAPADTKVLVKVNGVEIRASDVEPLLWEWRSQEVLQDLVNYQVVKDAATKANVKVEEAEVQTQLTQFMDQLQKSLQPGQTVIGAMQAEGSSPSRLYIRLKTELLLRKLIMKDFKQDDWVKVSTIIVKIEGTGADATGKAMAKANDALTRLKKGENFEDVLKSVVTDNNAIQSKGLIGWRQYSMFPQASQNELKTLPAGGYTNPAQTQFGVQIFRLERRGKDATGDELEELKAFVGTVQRQAYFTELAKKANIERVN